MKTTRYFDAVRSRPDRAKITNEWILRVANDPEHEEIQEQRATIAAQEEELKRLADRVDRLEALVEGSRRSAP